MKTEAQILAKLEQVVLELERFSGRSTESPDVTEEQKNGAIFHLASVVIMGWILDCDAEVQQLITKLRIVGLAGTLEGKL